MSATIKIMNKNYTITDYKWSGQDEVVVAMLSSFIDPDGPSGADPNPDATAAQNVVDELAIAEMVRFDKLDYVPGRVY